MVTLFLRLVRSNAVFEVHRSESRILERLKNSQGCLMDIHAKIYVASYRGLGCSALIRCIPTFFNCYIRLES